MLPSVRAIRPFPNVTLQLHSLHLHYDFTFRSAGFACLECCDGLVQTENTIDHWPHRPGFDHRRNLSQRRALAEAGE
jgi:hypothetical protein